MIATIFKDSRSNTVPIYAYVDDILESIREPKVTIKRRVHRIRETDDTEWKQKEKRKLPWICFGGKFESRHNDSLIESSGFVILDIDKDISTASELHKIKAEVCKHRLTYACFVSPGGMGLKVLVKVPTGIDNDEYNRLFTTLQYEYKNFDKNNKGIVRACFASYDQHLYINKDSEIWTVNDLGDKEVSREIPKEIPVEVQRRILGREIIDKKPPTVANKQISNYAPPTEWEIFNYVCIKWAEDNVSDRGRNDKGFMLATACNDYGIPASSAFSLIFQYLSSQPGDHEYKESELHGSIKSAYKKPSENKKANLSWLKTQEQNKQLTKPLKLIKNESEAIQILSQTQKEISSKPLKNNPNLEPKMSQNSSVDEPMFWHHNGKRNEFINSDLLDHLENSGYRTYKYSKDSHIYVKIKNSLVTDIYSMDIGKNVLEHVRKKDKVAFNDLSKVNQLSEAQFLYNIEQLPEDTGLLRDTRNVMYFPFRNGIVIVTGENISIRPYIAHDGYVWERDVIDHDFKNAKSNDNFDFADFCRKISSNDQTFNGLVSLIGYMLNTYKDPSLPIITILNDINSNGIDSNGGTGKSLIMKAIGQMRTTCRVDGKSLDLSRDFVWQTLDMQHKIVAIDDLKNNFPFDKLFSIATDGFDVNKKYRDPINIPYEISPKIIMSANARVKGTDDSSMRRRFDVDLSGYFSANRQPLDEYGKRFFSNEDWGDYEWGQFYSFMIKCARFYLNNGLVTQDTNYQARRIFIETYGETTDSFFKRSCVASINKIAMTMAGIGEERNNVGFTIATKWAMANGYKCDINGTACTMEKISRKETCWDKKRPVLKKEWHQL